MSDRDKLADAISQAVVMAFITRQSMTREDVAALILPLLPDGQAGTPRCPKCGSSDITLQRTVDSKSDNKAFVQCESCEFDTFVNSMDELRQFFASPEAPTPANNYLLESLAAARDLLISIQHKLSFTPNQGYSTTMTQEEITIAKGIKSIGDIIASASASSVGEGWTPCAERLPDTPRIVDLVVNEQVETGHLYADVWTLERTGPQDDPIQFDLEQVDYWRERPEPPGKGKQQL